LPIYFLYSISLYEEKISSEITASF